MELDGKTYTLNQCEDIWKWFKESVIGEYTHYYYKVVFHTEEGLYAAYADDLNNGCFI
jgi:hypothetical protein